MQDICCNLTKADRLGIQPAAGYEKKSARLSDTSMNQVLKYSMHYKQREIEMLWKQINIYCDACKIKRKGWKKRTLKCTHKRSGLDRNLHSEYKTLYKTK